MGDLIVDTPEIPERLLSEMLSKKVAFFIGAGVSRLLGCPSWGKLAKLLVDCCYENGYIDITSKQLLDQDDDPKKVITICHQIFVDNKDEASFLLKIWGAFKGCKKKIDRYNVYNFLNEMDALYITTNFDNHFNKQFLGGRLIHFFDKIEPTSIYRNKLYKIHGSLCDIKNSILTVPQYMNLYNNPAFKTFIERIFEEYTIIFIGYGMSEFELLDFMITKLGKIDGTRHYILRPYFSNQTELFNLDKIYFNSMGVDVIGFSKDVNGYNQLYEVIEYWHKIITQTTPMLYDYISEMEEIVDEYEG